MEKSTIILRDMARKVAGIAGSEEQKYIKSLWARNNNLERVERPPAICRPMCWQELIPESEYVASHPDEHALESILREHLYHHDIIGDDWVIDPWIDINAVFIDTRNTMWGVPVDVIHTSDSGGSFAFNPRIREESDMDKLKVPDWKIDNEATRERFERIGNLIGDIIPIRQTYSLLGLGLALGYWASYLRGLDQLFVDMYDRPEWTHRFFRFLTDAHMEHFNGLLSEGHITRNDNSMLGHCNGLPQPDFDGVNVRYVDCWVGADSQEFTPVSPAMFEEFILQYQAPIVNLFGLTMYGCCEDLTHKYGLLKKHIKNLRRVTCSPWTNARAAVSELEDKYVIQWRPNPSDIVFNLTAEQIESSTREYLELFRGCHVDISLQDLQTCNGNPLRFREWAGIAKKVGEQVWSR